MSTHPKAPTGTRTFLVKLPIGSYLGSRGEPVALFQAARKFSSPADATLVAEPRGGRVVEVPDYLIDPVTGQYAGANGGGA